MVTQSARSVGVGAIVDTLAHRCEPRGDEVASGRYRRQRHSTNKETCDAEDAPREADHKRLRARMYTRSALSRITSEKSKLRRHEDQHVDVCSPTPEITAAAVSRLTHSQCLSTLQKHAPHGYQNSQSQLHHIDSIIEMANNAESGRIPIMPDAPSDVIAGTHAIGPAAFTHWLLCGNSRRRRGCP
jgi:hypothetical protein